jgi:OOP family OmpA-OmpF porin
MNNLKTALSLMVIGALITPWASAQSGADTDPSQNSAAWYFGADIGRSKAKIDDNSIDNALAVDGASSTRIYDRDLDTGFKVFGGYQFNDYFAIEGGYFDLGKFGYNATTVPAGTLNGDSSIRGLNVDVIGFLPLTEDFSAFGRIGANYSEAKDNFNSTGLIGVTNPDPSKKDVNYKFGVGLQYRITHALATRLEIERYRVDDAIGNKGDIDQLSIGLVYRFGEKTQMHAVAEAPPPPPPVVEAVVVAPVYVAPPPLPPPAPAKVSFSADSLFDFNKSDIKPAGKQVIDDFSAKLQGTSFDHITVTGHTDRIGSHADNMILSKRRAETVKAYLVSSAGIPADKIEAVGVDGDDPITKPDDCRGTKKTKALIACLQPDRRVDLEVTGTK